VHKLSRGQRLFLHAARSGPSQLISGNRSSLRLLSPAITSRRSIGNRPTKYYKPKQGRKRKPPTHRRELPAPHRLRKGHGRYWLKHSAPPQLHSSLRSDLAVDGTIRWRLQW